MLKSLVSIVAFTGLCFGAPAMPGFKEISQPDGKKLLVQLWGDEWLAGYETADGYTIVKNSDGYWVYAELDDFGRLVPSQYRADNPPPPFLEKGLRPRDSLTISRVSSLRKAAAQKVVPSTGTGKVPVVLIQFPDKSGTLTTAEFQKLFFGTNAGDFSMKQYFEEVSYGNFTVTGEVVDWVTSSQNHAYYGTNATSKPGDDQWPGDLVYEAAQAADPSIDYSQYDTDGDCKVDVIAVIHAGTGEENQNYGGANDIWSHRWSLSGAQFYSKSNYGPYTTQDTCQADNTKKVVVDDYIIMSEVYNPTVTPPVISGVGLMAHEYAHALGLPDLYDTDDSSEGIGEWGLMGSGTWNQVGSVPGNRPAHMTAWSKAVLGWVSPTVVTGTLNNQTIEPVVNNKNHIFQFLPGNPGLTGEYFLIENRQQINGTFDEGLPASGLLIWHIDESKATTDNTDNANECMADHGDASCATDHYRVALEQADGNWDLETTPNNKGDAGDPFPGTTSKTAFSDSSTPSAKLYGGANSSISVTGITVSGNNIIATLDASGVSYPDISVSPTSKNFGDVSVGSSATATFTISNNGSAQLSVSGVQIPGSNAFSVNTSGGSNPCGSLPFTVGVGNNCTITVTVSPSSTGALTATLEINSDDPDTPTLSINLTANGVQAPAGANGCGGGGCSVGSVTGSLLMLLVPVGILIRRLRRI